MSDYCKIIKNKIGAVALILVVMITSLTLVSAVIIALINISDLTANYHISESEKVQVNIDACVNDALLRIASSTAVSGDFTLTVSTTDCTYNIGTAVSGIKIVTSTATSTGDLGAWSRKVKLEVNASRTPIMIDSYKDIIN